MEEHGSVEGFVEGFFDRDAIVDDFSNRPRAVSVLSHVDTPFSVYPKR
jgi:hypothetical protein